MPSPLAPTAQHPSLFTIGLTGGIGSGKSKVADLFVEHGAALIDTDEIAHRLTAPEGAAIAAIRTAFGDGVIAPDGRMDRAAMRALVFAAPARRKELEGILHPLIQATVRDELSRLAEADLAFRPPYVLIAVPLLAQASRAQRLAVAHAVINNADSLADTAAQVDRLHARFLAEAAQA